MSDTGQKSAFTFSADYVSATKDDGTTVSFTRSEARAISAMAAKHGRVVSRNQILDAVSEPGSEKNDRNVDFLINRIRRKLGDSATDPRFIATRYGEGYVWLEKPNAGSPAYDGAYIVIGPIRGLELLNGPGDFGRRLADRLSQGLRNHLGDDQRIAIDPDFSTDNLTGNNDPIASIELTFFRERDVAECVVSAKSTQTKQICFVRRFPLYDREGVAIADAQIAPLPSILLAKVWGSEAASAIDHLPLPVAMHEAASGLDRTEVSWFENDAQLRTLREEHPDDPALKFMYATHLHTKYVTLGRELFRKGEDNCRADEAEIEKLVLETLDYVQTRPEYAIMAAKLLFFVDRGYKNLALELAGNGLRSSTAIASSLTIVGQLRGFTGDTELAIDNLRQAQRLSEKGSHFYIYVLVLLCQVLMAAGRRQELADVRQELYSVSTIGAVFFEPLFSDPEKPSIRAKTVTLLLSRPKASAILKHLYYVSARLFMLEEHRENSLRTPINLFVRRFGRDVVPDEIKQSVPRLFN